MKKTALFNAIHDSLSHAGIHHVYDSKTAQIRFAQGTLRMGKNLIAVQCDHPEILLPVIRHFADHLVSSQRAGMVRSFFYSKGILIQLAGRTSADLCFEKLNAVDQNVFNQLVMDMKYGLDSDRDRKLFLKLTKSKNMQPRRKRTGKQKLLKVMYA